MAENYGEYVRKTARRSMRSLWADDRAYPFQLELRKTVKGLVGEAYAKCMREGGKPAAECYRESAKAANLSKAIMSKWGTA